jgi:uncharacterized membrane protein
MQAWLEIALVAMTPLAEAQVAVPLAYALGYSWPRAVLACSVGSVALALTLPFVLACAERLLGRFLWMQRLLRWLTGHVERRFTDRYRAWGWLGLLVFVAIPGPGSGVWTGALAAWLLRYKPFEASTALAAGAVLAATSVALIASGGWRVWHVVVGLM